FTPDFLPVSGFGESTDLLSPFKKAPAFRFIPVSEPCRAALSSAWSLMHERGKMPNRSAGIRIALLNVLYEISLLAERHFPEQYSQSSKSLPEQHVQKIIKYIEEHYAETITADVLAEELFLSKYYISHIFHQVT